jgi:Fe2+ transport system protein FeoA
LGQAPMGDPVEYLVVGYRLSLRRAEARRVWIERA